MPRSKKDIFAGSTPSMNMSAMIDLVFLLLIFFMVASKMITVPKIDGLEIPTAVQAKVPKDAKGRVVVNIRTDGVILNSTGDRELTLMDVENMVREAKLANPKTQLHIRADQNTVHEYVSEVMKASSRGGVTNVIFSAYSE